MGYSPWGCKGSHVTWRLNNNKCPNTVLDVHSFYPYCSLMGYYFSYFKENCIEAAGQLCDFLKVTELSGRMRSPLVFVPTMVTDAISE